MFRIYSKSRGGDIPLVRSCSRLTIPPYSEAVPVAVLDVEEATGRPRVVAVQHVLQEMRIGLFVSNNPINATDPWGLAPGDPYTHRSDAIRDLATDAYNRTNKTGVEAGGYLYEKGGQFFYSELIDGRKPTDSEYRRGVRGTVDLPICPPLPAGARHDANLHSHNVEGGGEQLSPDDIRKSKEGVEELIVAPSGNIVGYFIPRRSPGVFLKPPVHTSHGNIFKYANSRQALDD